MNRRLAAEKGETAMRFGICADAAQAAAMKALGYDYLEGNLAELARVEEAQLECRAGQLRAAGIWQETFNGFFPGDMPLVSRERDLREIQRYTARALERAARLGGRLTVLGSGRARAVPADMTRGEAGERFAQVARLIGDEAAAWDMSVVIEPLSAGETNLLSTVKETVAFCRALGHPRVGVLADLFHMHQNGEAPDAAAQADALLWHVHICNPLGRRCPGPGDGYDYAPFAQGLAGCGYAGRVTIEAQFREFDAEAAAGAEALRRLWPK